MAKYVGSNAIFAIYTIYGSIELIDVPNVLCAISIRIGPKERKNSVASNSSQMILAAQIFEFFAVSMNFYPVLTSVSKLYNTILLKHSNNSYIPGIAIIFNKNSIVSSMCCYDDINSVGINKDTDDSSWWF